MRSSCFLSFSYTYTYLLQCTAIAYGCLFSIRVLYFLPRFLIYSLRFFDSFNFGIYGKKLVRRQERDSEGLKSVLPLDLANYRSGNLIKGEEQGISIPYTTQSAYFTAIESRKDFLYIFVASLPSPSCWLGRERACSYLKCVTHSPYCCFVINNQKDRTQDTLFHTTETIRPVEPNDLSDIKNRHFV
jgi:hypothetical protein